MGEEKKRWIAMYTKQLTQKRKVFHDGFLVLHLTRKKVLLYDEGENVLESRMLKSNEVVSSGERLTFQAYLVDICEPTKEDHDDASSHDPPSSHHSSVPHRKPFPAVLRPNFKRSSPYSAVFKKKRQLHKFADSVKPIFEGNSGADLSRPENDKYSKDVPPHQPLRDVNQILSILQRPNATATCSDINPKTPMSLTKVPPESDTSKNIKVEPISPRASRDSFPQQRETSPAKTSARTMTRVNSASPSFDLGI